jgi:hypothetical protein
MASQAETIPDWERLLAAERHVQHLVPGAVLVGGSAAAVHAGHRVSLDGDHVIADLRDRFDDVLAALEAVAGWRTDRVQRPVLILGQMVVMPARPGVAPDSRPSPPRSAGSEHSG